MSTAAQLANGLDLAIKQKELCNRTPEEYLRDIKTVHMGYVPVAVKFKVDVQEGSGGRHECISLADPAGPPVPRTVRILNNQQEIEQVEAAARFDDAGLVKMWKKVEQIVKAQKKEFELATMRKLVERLNGQVDTLTQERDGLMEGDSSGQQQQQVQFELPVELGQALKQLAGTMGEKQAEIVIGSQAKGPTVRCKLLSLLLRSTSSTSLYVLYVFLRHLRLSTLVYVYRRQSNGLPKMFSDSVKDLCRCLRRHWTILSLSRAP